MNKATDKVRDSVQDAMGKTVPMEVTVPEGAVAGGTILVQGPNGNWTNVRVPEGLSTGQSFTADVPVSVATEKTIMRGAEKAPEQLPIIQPMTAAEITQSQAPRAGTVSELPAEQPAAAAGEDDEEEQDVPGHQKIMRKVSGISKDVQRQAEETQKRAAQEWNDTPVKCPSCAAMLRIPTSLKVVECGGCHTKVNNVGADVRLNFHLTRFTKRLTGAVQDALGETVPINIALPEGFEGGQTIPVQAGPGGDTVLVTVPMGLQPGQEFTADVPKSKFAHAPLAARTAAAPEVNPVAQLSTPSEGYPSGGYPDRETQARASGANAADASAALATAAEKTAAVDQVQCAAVLTGIPVDLPAAGSVALTNAATEKVEANNAASDKAASEKADAEKIALDKSATEQADALKVAADKAAAEQADALKAAADKAAAEKAAAADKAAAEQADALKAAVDKAAAEKAEAEKAAADKVAADKATADEAEKAAADKASAEKAEAEKVAAEKVVAEKVEADKAIAEAEKAASDKAAIENAAAEEKAAGEKAAADKAAAEKAAEEKVAVAA